MAQSYSTIAEMEPAEFAQTTGAILAGYMAPALVRYGVESTAGFDLPDEVYGAAVIAGGEYLGDGGRLVRFGQVGGAVYITEKVAERLGIKEQVTGAVSGGAA
ncbi:hypothetical protein ACKVMT_10010 [Halobacteriales archaeon Cl-PHB]